MFFALNLMDSPLEINCLGPLNFFEFGEMDGNLVSITNFLFREIIATFAHFGGV